MFHEELISVSDEQEQLLLLFDNAIVKRLKIPKESADISDYEKQVKTVRTKYYKLLTECVNKTNSFSITKPITDLNNGKVYQGNKTWISKTALIKLIAECIKINLFNNKIRIWNIAVPSVDGKRIIFI